MGKKKRSAAPDAKAREKPAKGKKKAKVSNYMPSSFRFFTGATASGEIVTEYSAMQIAAVFCCVRILAEAVASLPLHTYYYSPEGGKVKAIEHPLYTVLHDEPNAEMTSFVFRETLMAHILLYGNGYAQIIRNGRGETVGLYPLMPDKMIVDRDEKGHLYYQYYTSNKEVPTLQDGSVILKPEDVLHIHGMGYDGLIGYSPIAMAKNAIGVAAACEKFGASYFANGAAPGAILTHPTTLKNPKKVRDAWETAFRGPSKSNRVAVLEEGLTYTPISINPAEAQFLETRKFQINEIARIFRIPPHMIGDLEKSSFSNIEQQSLEFVTYTLDPWLIRWEQAIHKALFTPDEKKKYFAKFNVDGLLRGDYKSRVDGYAVARQNGWMNVNEIRELEGMDRIPASEGGDLYLVNGNMSKLKDAGAAYDTGCGRHES